MRLWPVFVLGSRFSGLVAIQSGHTPETHGIYSLVRNPSYLGMIINMLGWGLAFRGWSGRCDCFATVGAADPTHSLRRAPSGGGTSGTEYDP